MRRRPIVKFRPDLERFEEKQLLSAGPSAARAAGLGSEAAGGIAGGAAVPQETPRAQTGYLVYRITNPSYPTIVRLIPPFQHVLVQKAQPVPGKVYNLLFVVVRNGTAKTFTASDGLTVRLPGFTGTQRVTDKGFPLLTGNEVWKPGAWMVFYAIGKEYYPLSPQVAAGFQLQAGGRSSTIIPGPSGIFLRLKYNPATFDRTLDWIVAYGQGAQLGHGPPVGMPDTIINTLVSAKTQRMDYAGHF
jgi:hypothetical protein